MVGKHSHFHCQNLLSLVIKALLQVSKSYLQRKFCSIMTIYKSTILLNDMKADFKVQQLNNKVYTEKEPAVALLNREDLAIETHVLTKAS